MSRSAVQLARHSRERRRNGSGGVSLFPFLAVLICTMGSLIVLLIVTARHSRVQAGEAARASNTRTGQGDSRLQQERDDVAWRVDLLRQSLEKTHKQLADAQLAVGHVEDHSRRLADEVTRLREAWKQLNAQAGVAATGPGGSLSLEQTKIEIARLEAELAQLAAKIQGQQGSYAIVPYVGPYGTFRRPIYLECRADAVVLQPEGIRLVQADFEGPQGPGNPLASLLRAVREEWARRGEIDPSKSGEPYPLLLVRPAGAAAYALASHSLRAWNSDFGYEPVDAGWNLEFGQADPATAQRLQQVLDDARIRHRRLAELARRRSPSSGDRYYTVTNGRGVVALDGSPADEDDVDDDSGSRGRSGRRSSRWTLADSDTDSHSDGDTGGNSGGVREGFGSLGETGTPSRGTFGTGADSPGMTGTSSQGTYGGGSSAATPSGSPSSGFSSGSGQNGSTQPSGSRDAAASRSGQQQQPGGSPAGQGASCNATARQSVASRRGVNWALPEAAPRYSPISHPIRINCHPDRLDVASQGSFVGKSVPLGSRTEDAVDPLVAMVAQVIESWGPAGDRMYWKPVLYLHTVPGAEGRAADLEVLLESSGLMVKRK